MMRDYRRKDKWIPGIIAQRSGPVSYRVQVDPMIHWRRHADQIIESQVQMMTPNIEISQSTQSSNSSASYVDNDYRETDVPEYISSQPVKYDVAPMKTPKVARTP